MDYAQSVLYRREVGKGAIPGGKSGNGEGCNLARAGPLKTHGKDICSHVQKSENLAEVVVSLGPVSRFSLSILAC